jgi:integrase
VSAVTTTASPAEPLQPGTLAAGRLDVAGYLQRWLAHTRGRVRAVTYEGYEVLLRRHALPRLGQLQLQELSPLVIQELYGELLAGDGESGGLSAGTVLNLHLVLNQAFAQAVRWQLLAANPVAGAQPPRPRRPPRLLVDPALLARLLASVADSWLEAPAAIAAAAGVRRGEILALRRADLTSDLTALRVQRTLQPTRRGLVFEEPKTARSRRTVLLPAFLRPYLERQLAAQAARRAAATDWQEQGLLIDRGDGRPLNPDTLSAGWARHLRRQQLPPVRFHDLRHAHATLMLAQGVHPKIVSERLGHASIGITLDTYSHVLPTLQQEAAAAFDALFPGEPG